MIRRPPRSTRKESSAASDVYKRQARLKGFYFVGSAGAGSVTLTLDGNAASDRVLLSIATPANVESQQMSLPGDGILINGNEPQTTFGVVTQTTAVTSLTVFCG